MTVGLIVMSVIAAAAAALWWREKQRSARYELEVAAGKRELAAHVERFRNVVDADAELRRVTELRSNIEAEAERKLVESARRLADDERLLAERRQLADATAAAAKAGLEAELAEAKRRAEAALAEIARRHEGHEQALKKREDEWATQIAAKDAAARRERDEKSARWEAEYRAVTDELEARRRELAMLTEEAEMQSFGLYKPLYDFAKAADFKVRLEEVRAQQKAMVKEGTAAVCSTVWTVSGSTAEGKRMVDRQIKLMLRAFNGECDALVAGVTWKNVVSLQERMERNFEAVNKLGETQQCAIQRRYLKLKQEELQLGFDYAEKLNAEREEQRAIREQMKEEEKARRQVEKEQADAENEEARYQKALDRAKAEAEAALAEKNAANEKQRAEIESKIAKLEGLLATAHERKERAVSQAQLTKSGYVYVLSNEGSFGPNVFKVGLTRRLDPQDRVDELGDASVPFGFDVHAIIRSDDAPALEAKLHEALEPHRVNLVNRRKEFFRTPIEKIVDLVSQHHGKFAFTLAGEAAEYRKTLAVRAEREAMVAGRSNRDEAKTRAEETLTRFEALKKAAG